MDQLLVALTKAVEQGTTLAYPALVGYFVVRVAESVVLYPLVWGVVFWGVHKAIRLTFQCVMELEDRAMAARYKD